MIRNIIRVLFIFFWVRSSQAGSGLLTTQTPAVDNSIIEMDLMGDGKTQKIKEEFYTERDSSGNSLYGRVTLYGVKTGGELEKLWAYQVPEAIKSDVETASLDPRKPKKTFLILHSAFGAAAGITHVFEWNGKAFEEVRSDDLWGYGEPQEMKDKRNVLVFATGDYEDGPPDIYIYRNGCLVPGNYLYPDFYQKEIDAVLTELRSDHEQAWLKQTLLSRGIMAFLYAKRIPEGVKVYDFLNQPGSVNGEDLALFRAYADLEMGDQEKGRQALLKIHGQKHYKRLEESWMNLLLGNYYYSKDGFEEALKYYKLVDAAHVNISPLLWKKKKELLEYLTRQ